MTNTRNLLGLAVLLVAAQSLPAQFYGMRTDLATGRSPSGVRIADMDGNGSPDLVSMNFSSDNASIFLGDGMGGFAAGILADMGPLSTTVKLTDLNGDGVPDVIAGSMLNQITTRLGDGLGGFKSLTHLQVGGPLAISVAVSDLNLDGIPDLVAATHATNSVSVRLGDGSGGFGVRTDFAVGMGPRSVAVSDLNGDGRPDLVTANQGEKTLSVLLGDGAGSFGIETKFSTGSFPTAIAIDDLNGDGFPDLMTANSYTGAMSSVSLLFGDGLGGFGPKTDIAVGIQVQCVASGDLDGDGHPDLVTANGGSGTLGSVSMMLGDGLGSFGIRTDLDVGFLAYSLDIGDLNADGRMDLVVANTNSDTISVLLNQTATPPGISSYGTGTPGCRGTMGISAYSIPMTGNADFAVNFTNTSPAAISFLMLSRVQDLAGSDPGYGLVIHLGMGSSLQFFPPVRSDASGSAHAPLPIPAIPSLVGMRFYAQGMAISDVGGGNTCSRSPIGMQTSKGLEIIVQ